MEGLGTYTDEFHNERFRGDFEAGSVNGWGEYQKVITNKIRHRDDTGKPMKGREIVTVWGNFSSKEKGATSEMNESVRANLMKMSVQS